MATEATDVGMGSSPTFANRPPNLASAVASELVERIVSGKHRPDSALPAEPALCAAFGVSRPVIREAMKMLQERGLISIRQGSGTVVTAPDTWSMLDESVLRAVIAQDDGIQTLDDIVVTRRLLESDMAYLAALVADAEAIGALRALVDTMDTCFDDGPRYAMCDLAFHDTIMRSSGNRVARAVVRSLESHVNRSPQYIGHVDRTVRVESNAGHRRVLDAVLAGDPVGARAAMHAHITTAWVSRRDDGHDYVRIERLPG